MGSFAECPLSAARAVDQPVANGVESGRCPLTRRSTRRARLVELIASEAVAPCLRAKLRVHGLEVEPALMRCGLDRFQSAGCDHVGDISAAVLEKALGKAKQCLHVGDGRGRTLRPDRRSYGSERSIGWFVLIPPFGLPVLKLRLRLGREGGKLLGSAGHLLDSLLIFAA